MKIILLNYQFLINQFFKSNFVITYLLLMNYIID